MTTNMPTVTNLTSRQLTRAAAIKKRIESLEDKLRSLLGDEPASNDAPRKYKMSAAGRAAIAAAAKKRWAKAKAAGKKTLKD
jgi:hypothetical protein